MPIFKKLEKQLEWQDRPGKERVPFFETSLAFVEKNICAVELEHGLWTPEERLESTVIERRKQQAEW